MLLKPFVFLHSVHQATNTYHTVQFMALVAETCSSLILIMNCILLFVFYFNLSSALVGRCTENRAFLFLFDRQATARCCSQISLHCDRLSVSSHRMTNRPTRDVRRNGGQALNP